MQQPDYPVYKVLIDIDTGEIGEDLQALRQAEEEARMQEYGKLETSLFNRLQEADDDEIFPVAIWAAEYDKSLSPYELYDILAARYPEAAQAMAEGRKPWRVEDGELSKEIRTAYFAELDKNAKTRVAPILAMLKSYEESVEHQWGEPRIVAEIPKKMILKLDRHPAVARIFYDSNEVVPDDLSEPEMDGATSTTSTPEGGLLIETIQEPQNCYSNIEDHDFEQTSARHKVLVLDNQRYYGDKVAVIVADREEELAYIGLLAEGRGISPEQTVADVLQQLDLDREFVVGAFRSLKGVRGCHNVVIRHVTQQQDTLTIHLEVQEVGDRAGICKDALSAPCHIVKVERPEGLVIEEDTVQVIPIAVTTTPYPFD